MKPITPSNLELMIARAKSSGEIIWYQVKSLTTVVHDGQLTAEAYDHFAAMCDAYGKEFTDSELGELLALEMFLRSGKRMPSEAKIINRKRADELKESILRRK